VNVGKYSVIGRNVVIRPAHKRYQGYVIALLRPLPHLPLLCTGGGDAMEWRALIAQTDPSSCSLIALLCVLLFST
jgi:hypothetical protein